MPAAYNTPGPELLKALRARLILENTSLTQWSAAKGIHRQNLTKALLGTWRGPTASKLVKDAIAAIEGADV